ncbi:little elongation complex subunit 1-like [Erethizon dorsatum]
MAKDTGDTQGSTKEELPEAEDDGNHTGGAVGPAGLDVRAGFSSFSTSVPVSVCSNPQSSQLEYVSDTDIPTKVIPPKLHHSEQKLQTETLNTLLQSEPPEHSVQENNPDSGLHALSPESGAPDLNDQKSREIECTQIIKGLTKICSFPQSVFRKATKDGHCETQDPRIELTLQKSGLASLTDSQAGLIKRGSGLVQSTSWHHSDLLRRSGEGPRATSEHEQKSNPQFEVAAPALRNRASAAAPQLPGENNSPVEFKAAAALLPNQVSVITKQARPQKTSSAYSEHLTPNRKELNLAAGNCDNRSEETALAAELGREGEDTTGNIKAVATQKSTAPEASSSWRKGDFNPPSVSLPAGNLDSSVNGKVSFSSEDTLTHSQEALRDTDMQDNVQTPRMSPPFLGPDPRGAEGNERLPAELAVSGGCPVEEAPDRDTGTPGTKTLAATSDPPSTSQDTHGPSKVASGTPGAAFLQHFVTADITFSSPLCSKAETQSGLLGTSFCCTGIREAGEKDSEGEGSESLFSCSESELEADGLVRGPQGAVGYAQKALGDSAQEDVSNSGQSTNFDKSRLRNRPVKPSSGDSGNAKTPRGQTQPILAKADTSTPTDCPLDTLSKIRQEPMLPSLSCGPDVPLL